MADNYVTIRKKVSGAKAIGIKVLPKTSTDLQKNVTSNSFGRKVGTHTDNIGDGGGEHTFTARIPGKDIKTVESILNYDGFIEITSQSKSTITGTYRVMKANIVQIKGLKASKQKKNYQGNRINIDKFEVTIVVQKHIAPSVSSKVFNNWNANAKTTTKSTSSTSSTAKKTNTKDAYAKITKLSACPLKSIVYGKTNHCIYLLQSALIKRGYYVKDQGIKPKHDGYYHYYTKRAVQKYQTNHKLKITGTFNKETRDYILKH